MILRRFNVRVYGILINEHDHLLVADELIRGKYTTKFPGGGLELGEGLIDGLVREFMEECGVPVIVLMQSAPQANWAKGLANKTTSGFSQSESSSSFHSGSSSVM